MKREMRKSWMDAHEGWLCGVCRYSESVGWPDGPPWDGQEPSWEWYCGHPLDVVIDAFDAGIEPGMDCWGFRPKKGERLVSVVEK